MPIQSDQISVKVLNRREFLQQMAAACGALALGATPFDVMADVPPAFQLGQLAPMTGTGAEYGPFYQDAAQLAVSQLNKAAEQVLGGPLISRLITEDTNALPQVAVSAARKLVLSDGVPAIVGAWSSGVTTTVATSVAIPNQVLLVSNASTSPIISVLPEDKKADLIFRTVAPANISQGVVLGQLAAGDIIDNYSYKEVAIIYVNNPYGIGLANAFEHSFKLRGGKVQAKVPHSAKVQPTYKSELAAALKGNPDLLFCASYSGHAAIYLKESRDIFNYTSWLFEGSEKSDKIIDAVGAKWLAGSLGTAPSADPSTRAYKDFKESFETEKGRKRISPFTVGAYDAPMTIRLAAARVITQGNKISGRSLSESLRSVSNPPGENVYGGSVDGIVKALEAIKKGKDTNYNGATGPINYDKHGDNKTSVEIWKYTANGKIRTVQVRSPDQIPGE